METLRSRKKIDMPLICHLNVEHVTCQIVREIKTGGELVKNGKLQIEDLPPEDPALCPVADWAQNAGTYLVNNPGQSSGRSRRIAILKCTHIPITIGTPRVSIRVHVIRSGKCLTFGKG
jgi:hypothetical protein